MLILILYLTLLVTVFNQKTEDRLKAWRQFRDSIETSETPFDDVALFWAKAPYNSKVLDPYYVDSWPDPWKLVIKNHYDLLAIALGMCYTFNLTARFKEARCQLYTSVNTGQDPVYICVVDEQHVLGLDHGAVTTKDKLPQNSILLWDTNNQK